MIWIKNENERWEKMKEKAANRMESRLLIPYQDILIDKSIVWLSATPINEILEWCKKNE